MTSLTSSVWLRSRTFITSIVIAVLAAAFLISDVNPARADESATPVVGSFGVGGPVTGGVDERTGVLGAQMSLATLPGVSGDPVDVGLSYAQDLAASGSDVFSLGTGWVWNMPRVDVNGGIRVSPASGGVFNADASQPSGLDGYVLGDVVFRQEPGVLPARAGVVGDVNYAFSLVYAGGLTDYFNEVGDLVARVNMFSARIDWLWQADVSHRLVAVVDDGGSRADVVWTDAGVEVVAPKRSDGVVSKTTLGVSGGRLMSITDPTQEQVRFGYEDAGLLEQMTSDSGAITEVSYQRLPDVNAVVDTVRVVDSTTGAVLSVREWDALGEHNAQGWPTYTSQGELWASGGWPIPVPNPTL